MYDIRIAILNANDEVLGFMDNTAPKALHYYEDELHEYIKGSAATYSFTASARHEDSKFLVVGNKLAFQYSEKDYYMNIVRAEADEFTVYVTAFGGSFELLNEYVESYDPGKAVGFSEYLSVFDPEHSLTLGNNEVELMGEWHVFSSRQTLLARLFELAETFRAEIEIVPELDKNYSLKRMVLNVYREHSDTRQGIGKDRTDITLRYGKNVTGIKKTSDIRDLYTAIRPYGSDGINLLNYTASVKDSNGEVEYECVANSYDIRAVQARERFPSNRFSGDRYIVKAVEYEEHDIPSLYLSALNDLKKNCVPQVTYEINGYFETGIGDTVSVEDEEFNPPLILEARVTEQVVSFTDDTRCKSTFSNVKELQSKIDPTLIAKMNALIAQNKTYTCTISTDNGIVFRNGEGTTTLTANVRDAGTDMTDSLTIKWSLNGVQLATGKTITVKASDVIGKSVYRFEAFDSTGILRGFYEVTVSNVADGQPGADGISPTITVNADTSLTITDRNGEQTTPVLKGEKGDKGATGPATGITVSATAPTTKYTGMLWKHTGTVSGLIKNATYRWNGSAWKLYMFQAANIDVVNLFAQKVEATGAITATDFRFRDKIQGVRNVSGNDSLFQVMNFNTGSAGGNKLEINSSYNFSDVIIYHQDSTGANTSTSFKGAISNLFKYPTLQYRGNISSSLTNLDSIKNFGIYRINGNKLDLNITSFGSNLDVTARTTWGMLISLIPSGSWGVQLLLIDGPGAYFRVFMGSSPTFSRWMRLHNVN